MKIHLAWIRVSAAAAIAACVGVPPVAAQYVPYRPLSPEPVAPQAAPVAPAAPVAAAPAATPYVAYRPQPAAQTAVSPYPQTAAAQYPATYGAAPYYVAQQPTEAMPAPQQPSTSTAPGATSTMPATTETMPPGTTGASMSVDASGYGAAGCGCNAGGCTSGSCGCNSAYPDVSSYFGGCNENQWFGGVYYLLMTRENPDDVRFTVQIDHNVASNPYYPPQRTTIIETQNNDADFRSGVEARIGSTFTIGDSCGGGCGSGYGYGGCGCNSCGCAPTTYAWEAAWWGLEDDQNTTVRSDDVTSNIRIYGMKNFNGLQYDRDGAGGAYDYRPVNYYYGYNLPIPTPPAPSANSGLDGGNYVGVLAQRVYTDFKAQNLELNIIRFPTCQVCSTGCNSGCGCGGYDAGGCNTGCACQAPTSCFSMYGSCGVRYFRIDDDLSYDTEFAEWSGGAYDQPTYNGFSFDNSNELCYDVQIDNNLVGPQLGWTTDYCICCRWNLFMNSTFGIFDNHINQWQRMWSGGGGNVTLADGSNFNVRSNKDNIAFLGELRVGCAYDISCHWRAIAAYRALALTGIATSAGQIPDNFSSRAEVAQINSDNSLVIHGIQTGVECRY